MYGFCMLVLLLCVAQMPHIHQTAVNAVGSGVTQWRRHPLFTYRALPSTAKVISAAASSLLPHPALNAQKPRDQQKAQGIFTKRPFHRQWEATLDLAQKKIVMALEALEAGFLNTTGQQRGWFTTDHYQRPNNGGGGKTMVLQEGGVFEKAGVSTAVVVGPLSPALAKTMVAKMSLADTSSLDALPSFYAAGLSLVLHPHNPFVPTVHANYRYFEIFWPHGCEDKEAEGATEKTASERLWWFGGGCDLTPSYIFQEDAQHFHQTLKTACDAHDRSFYPKFKRWCDSYFCIPHRNETRGIGGIFFDHLQVDKQRNKTYAFVSQCLQSFVDAYLPIVYRRLYMEYGEREKRWQQLRRGRYVEFNLIYDRGTRFGLKTPNARVESILMSLPLTARWVYQPKSTTTPRRMDGLMPYEANASFDEWEDYTVSVLRHPMDWIPFDTVHLKGFTPPVEAHY